MDYFGYMGQICRVNLTTAKVSAEPLVELENDKPTVLALREIAEGLISHEILDEHARQASLMEEATEGEAEADAESGIEASAPAEGEQGSTEA